MSKPKQSTHTWRISGRFVMACGKCGRQWTPDRREPRDKCEPEPDKAVVA